MPRLAAISISKLTATDVRKGLAEVASCNAINGTTLRSVHSTLYSMLEAARREGLVASNVMRDVACPPRANFEARPLTQPQASRLIAHARKDQHVGALVVLALATGMRQGELLALTWSRVDMDRESLTVAASVVRRKGTAPSAGPTKTRSGRRVLPLDSRVVWLLVEHRARQAECRLNARTWTDRDLVFPSPTGGYLNPGGRMHAHWVNLLSRAQCPRIRFHDLRHTAGLILTRETGLVATSRILGHATPAITLRHYGHAQKQDLIKGLDALACQLFPADQTPTESAMVQPNR